MKKNNAYYSLFSCSIYVLNNFREKRRNKNTSPRHTSVRVILLFWAYNKSLLEFISVPFFAVILYFHAFGLITTSRDCSYAASFTYMT